MLPGFPDRIASGPSQGMIDIDRSVPNRKSGWLPISGIEIFHEGPSHIHDCKFYDFRYVVVQSMS